jgi:hypothetical protein
LALATLSAEGSPDFLPAIRFPGSVSLPRRSSTSVERRERARPATDFPRWTCPASCRP